MYSEPNKSIFKRENAIVNVNLILKKKINIAIEVRNYGSNLIFKAYKNSEHELLDSVLILNFLLRSVNLLDSIVVLAKEGCHSTVPYFIRGIIENSFYIEWLLAKNSQKRTEYFYTYILYEELQSNSFAKDNPKGFIENLDAEDLLLTKDFESFFDSRENPVEKIKNHLKTHFPNHYKRLKDNVPAKWYSVNKNINSLEDIAREIDRKAEYKIFYRNYSKSIHSTNIRENLKVTKRGGEVTPTRAMGNLDNDLKNTLLFCIRIYRRIIQEYLPDKEDEFNQIYINRWREYFNK